MVCALLAAACGNGSSDDGGGGAASSGDEPLQVTFLPATESLAVLPQLQAIAMDYFADEGIELDYLGVLQNAAQTAQAVATGQADVTITGTTGLLATLGSGRDAVGFGFGSSTPTAMLTLSDEGLEKARANGATPTSSIDERVAALEGLTIAAPAPGSTTDVVLRKTLLDRGLDPDRDIEIQPVTDEGARIAAAREGQVDGYASQPPESVAAVAEGWGDVWVSWIGGDVPEFDGFPQLSLVTSRSFLDEDREAVEGFTRAIWRAVEDLRDDPDAARAAVKERWFPDMDEALFDEAFDAALPSFVDGLEPTSEGLDIALEVVNEGRPDQIDLTFDEVYDTSVVEATAP